jgi:hypothetical protein
LMPRAFGAKPENVAVPQLVHLHARLSAKLAECRAAAKQARSDLKHVEAVIRLFDSEYDVRRIPGRRRNQANPWFKRGTLFRAALGVLRKADKPMTFPEIGRALLASKGVTDCTPDQFDKLCAGVRTSPANHEGRSVARVGEGKPARWGTDRELGRPLLWVALRWRVVLT